MLCHQIDMYTHFRQTCCLNSLLWWYRQQVPPKCWHLPAFYLSN